MIIGIAGYARAGKNEVAKIIEKELGLERVAFADKLRDFLYELNPPVIPNPQGAFAPEYAVTTLREVIDRYGWEDYKDSPYSICIRELIQRCGTEAGQKVLGQSIWVDLTLTNDNLVVQDVRFLHEARAIRDRGGEIFRVERPGTTRANDHRSETELEEYPYDGYIMNNGSLNDLTINVMTVLGERNLTGSV